MAVLMNRTNISFQLRCESPGLAYRLWCCVRKVDRIKDDGPVSESYTAEGLMSVVYVPLVPT